MQNNVEIIVRCSGKESTLSGEFLIGAVTQGDGEHGEKKAEALLADSIVHVFREASRGDLLLEFQMLYNVYNTIDTRFDEILTLLKEKKEKK